MIPRRLLLLFPMLIALAGFALAQGTPGVGGGPGSGSGGSGAPDDSYWSFGPGDTAHLDVTDNPNGGVWTTATSAGGFTGAANGTQGPDTPSGLTTCRNSGAMTNAGGDEYKVIDGKLAKRGADRKWKKGKKIPKPKPAKNVSRSSFGSQHLTAGSPAPFDGVLLSPSGTADLLTGDLAPWDGLLVPADDVVSAPAL